MDPAKLAKLFKRGALVSFQPNPEEDDSRG